MALLQRFRFTTEGYRERFRGSSPNNGETGSQYAARLEGLFDRWVEVGLRPKTYGDLRDLVIAEQFIKGCHLKLAVFLKERSCNTLPLMAAAADKFMEAHRQDNLAHFKEDHSQCDNDLKNDLPSIKQETKIRCFLCGRVGHRATDCVSRPEQRLLVCQICQRSGHDAKACFQRKGGKTQLSCFIVPESGSTACEFEESHMHNEETHGVEQTNEALVSVVCDKKDHQPKRRMPVERGLLDGQPAKVLRDTGCNTAIVRRKLVGPQHLTGKQRQVVLVDGTCKLLPEAIVRIASSYFTGEVVAKCMDEPLYDVIIGNVQGAKEVLDLEPNGRSGEEAEATESLQLDRNILAALKSHVPATPNPTPNLGFEDVTKDVFQREQLKDTSLDICRGRIANTHVTKGGNTYSFYLSKGVLFRRCLLANGKEFRQVVVPRMVRHNILSLAHDIAMAGHQGAKRASDRVLESFYWPGVLADVKRFVRSCDLCQRTIPKGMLSKAPLGRMPIIETPFERVAIDLIGPLSPTSKKGNRFILTLVDFATRYPDAVALPSTDSRTVAEGLIEMFSRVGLPREILSDRGTSFTSELMNEVMELLSIKHLLSSPYHPMCNGLVGKFKGTLKQMLKRMCEEKPQSWDEYLAPVLFAYREAPQASLGFSPFELIYGRHIRGPLSVLKEIWTEDTISDELKTTYSYVLELRSRHNKLLMQWKGPFPVVEKKNEVDYKLNLGHAHKVFHINMLKRYEEREAPFSVAEHVGSFIAKGDEEDVNELPSIGVQRSQGPEDVLLSKTLTDGQLTEVKKLLYNYDDVFSDVPGKTDLLHCHLELSTSAPVRTQQYPIPFAMKETIEREV
ncbi:uncharacterized protein LOC120841353 [Ixodes scapularis]|uniref:uncharacterized protein LOC120841353 n=1 Tax=Ixodes scapularis TaxID=6945 RepID=UPI001A9CC732|nr:uncharacterized protein LOC120841353 [Ixodes scapularis]